MHFLHLRNQKTESTRFIVSELDGSVALFVNDVVLFIVEAWVDGREACKGCRRRFGMVDGRAIMANTNKRPSGICNHKYGQMRVRCRELGETSQVVGARRRADS